MNSILIAGSVWWNLNWSIFHSIGPLLFKFPLTRYYQVGRLEVSFIWFDFGCRFIKNCTTGVRTWSSTKVSCYLSYCTCPILPFLYNLSYPTYPTLPVLGHGHLKRSCPGNGRLPILRLVNMEDHMKIIPTTKQIKHALSFSEFSGGLNKGIWQMKQAQQENNTKVNNCPQQATKINSFVFLLFWVVGTVVREQGWNSSQRTRLEQLSENRDGTVVREQGRIHGYPSRIQVCRGCICSQ